MAQTVDVSALRMFFDTNRLAMLHPDLTPNDETFNGIFAELHPAYTKYVTEVSVPGHAVSLQTASYLLFLCRALEARNACDLGSGFSSYVLNHHAATADYPVQTLSVDTDPEWLCKSAAFTPSGTFISWDEFQQVPRRFDLIFHDLAGGTVRTDAITTVVASSDVVLFDDAHHPDHRAEMYRACKASNFDLFSLHNRTLDDSQRFAMLGLPAQLLEAQYGLACSTDSDINEHLPRFVDLTVGRNAQHVIELGSRGGVSTIAWLYALEMTGGRLTTVDLDPAPEIATQEHWRHVQGDDLDPTVIDQLDPADIVFIDTSHAYDQTLKELHVYRWLLKPGGLILCHDTEVARPEGTYLYDPVFPVKSAIKRFCEETGATWVNWPDCNGLGIIQLEG